MGDQLGLVPGWVWALLVVAVLTAWYLTYTAARLDRLHTRAEGALSALDGQLVRRAQTALTIGASGLLEPADAYALTSAASACLEAPPFAGDTVHEPGALVFGFVERADLDSELSALLRALLDAATQERLRLDDDGADLLDRLADSGLRVQLARGLHDQAVADAAALRRHRAVRAFHLAGCAAPPRPVRLDDALPEGLSPRRTMAP